MLMFLVLRFFIFIHGFRSTRRQTMNSKPSIMNAMLAPVQSVLEHWISLLNVSILKFYCFVLIWIRFQFTLLCVTDYLVSLKLTVAFLFNLCHTSFYFKLTHSFHICLHFSLLSHFISFTGCWLSDWPKIS